ASVAASPQDPAVRLKYARIMFSAGKPEAAVAKLDEAIKLVNAGGAPRDPIFVTAKDFANKLAKDHRDQLADLTSGLFDRAAAAATTASQNVEYRVDRADFAKQRNHPQDEVQLYQQILSDSTLRSVSVPDADGNSLSASLLAKRAIDDAIRRGGIDIYAPFERAANQMLDEATKAISPDQLQSIAQVYPNSTAAPKALLAAADMYEKLNNPRRSTQVLRQLYIRYPENADRATVIEAMARNYLLMPNRVDVALARLNQGARLPGSPKLTKPLVLPDGKKIENVSFADAAAMLKQYGTQELSAELPDIALPPLPRTHEGGLPPAFLPESPDSIISGVASLLTPAPQFARNDRIVTFTPGTGLRIFAVGSTQPIMTSDAIAQPTGVAWIGHNLLVWTDYELAYLAVDNAQTLWTTSIKNVPQIDVVAQSGTVSDDQSNDSDPAPNPPAPPVIIQPHIRIFNGQRVIIRPGGRMMVVGLPQPQTDQPAKPAVEQIAQICPLMDRAILATSDGRIIAIDLDGGKFLWQTRLADHAPTHLLATDDFVAALISDEAANKQLCVFDTFSGQTLTRRSFNPGAEDTGGMVPLNLALASDGTLVYLMPDRVCIKDLFEPGGLEKLTFESAPRTDGEAPFQTSLGPDQLKIADDRIIAVADNGATVRIYSLHDGSLLHFNQGDAILRTNSNDARLWLRVAGAQIYVATQREMRGYDAERGTTWSSLLTTGTATNVRDLVVARGHVVAITEPAAPRLRRAAEEPMPFLQLKAFSRAIEPNGGESGVFEHDANISANAAILAWQVVDGGFYYLGSDQQLHFLHGARNVDKPKS
ncbi:MAG TPA: hypothetical protein VKK61_02095, partial [Tepidisphaeraceae bacterium]|nr:hypothetical protein [Tepidisphaeraceae bacterium]